MQLLFDHIARRLSEHFNEPVQITHRQQVFGGDTNHTFHLKTSIGSFFLKLNNGHLKDMFEREFEGLQLLYQTNTIKIPQPVLYGSFSENALPAKTGIHSKQQQIFLITEYIQKGSPSKNFWQIFAHQITGLHKHSNDQFGLSTNNYIGSLPQQNGSCNSWAEFYATQRIMPLMQLSFNQNKCSKKDLLSAESLCGRLPGLFPAEQPALLHGDLWAGNFMSGDNGEPIIYDPAVYYGNREMDIAMSLLFGGFDKSFYTHYNEVFPLQPGWEQRTRLCQLYPLLVHLVLFGGHYYNSVLDIINGYN
ncbi:MAG TPA: fructosamine kinase family protein [Parafilimonas sp.]|nr:fructosamine kinase family protein [Parafilimonas sp.]